VATLAGEACVRLAPACFSVERRCRRRVHQGWHGGVVLLGGSHSATGSTTAGGALFHSPRPPVGRSAHQLRRERTASRR
jgi:hypothetical protein